MLKFYFFLILGKQYKLRHIWSLTTSLERGITGICIEVNLNEFNVFKKYFAEFSQMLSKIRRGNTS